MRKAISPVISVALLILMTIGASVMSFTWISSIQSSVQEQAGEQAEQLPVSECSKLEIITVSGNKAIVSNTGCDTVSDVNLFIDDELTDYDLSQPLGPGESTTINYNSLKEGETHKVDVVLANGETSSGAIEECGPEDGCSNFNFTINTVSVS